jgi:hypothetical protein
MSYTEVTHEGWFSRIAGSIKSLVIGGLLVLIAVPVLFWGEGRAVKRAKDLEEGRGAVLSVDPKSVDPANDKKLVHFSAMATADGALNDPMFAVTLPNAIKLKRQVEMYQWKEHKKTEKRKKMGGGEETRTTYSYSKTWDDDLIDSSDFHSNSESRGKNNPKAKLWNGKECRNEEWTADLVTAGAFTLPKAMLGDLDDYQTLPTSAANASLASDTAVESGGVDPTPVKPTLPPGLKTSGDSFYTGNPSDPQIGDLRITLKAIKPQDVTVLGVQTGSTLSAYQTKTGNTLMELRPGAMSAEQFFSQLNTENTITTWIIRIVGFLAVWIGLMILLNPLKVLADVVPALGSIAGFGIALVTFFIALIITLVTIAIGWIFYRPLLGIILLAVAALAIYGLRRMRAKTPPPPLPAFPTAPPIPVGAAAPLPPLPPSA